MSRSRIVVLAALVLAAVFSPLATPAHAASFTGTVSPSGAKVFPVTLAANDVVVATVTWSGNADVNISAKNANGAVVATAFSTPTSGPEKIAFKATTAGSYKFTVSSKSGTGNFTLTVDVGNLPSTLTYPSNSAVAKSGKVFQLHNFSVPAPGLVNITLNWPTSSANLNIFVKDPRGNTKAQSSSGTARPERVSFAATVLGTYEIKITIATGASNYSLDTSLAMGNQAPVANNDTASALAATATTLTVLANDASPDGDPLTITSVTQGDNGATVTTDGTTVTYVAASGFSGVDSFSYTVCDDDPSPLCDTATVNVSVRNGNAAPIAADDTATAISGIGKSITPLSNDSDPDGDALSLGTVGTSPNATIAKSGNTITYAATGGYTGTDAFTYEVCDNFVPVACATGTVTVTVSANTGGGGDFSGYYYWSSGLINNTMKAYMADPLVSGLSVVRKWKEVEPTYGNYDWTILDNWANVAQELNKPLLIRIYYGNTADLPAWLFSEHGGMNAVTKFHWSGHHIPHFWHPTLQRDWRQFVNAMGARYGHRNKLIPMITGPWEAFGEPFIPCVQESEKTTWTNDYRAFTGNPNIQFADVQQAYLNFELDYLLPTFANAFSTQPLGHATGRLMCDNPSTHPVLQQIFNAGRTRYGSFSRGAGNQGFFMQNNALMGDPYPITNWLSVNYNPVDGAINKGPIGYQPLGCTQGYCNNGQLISVDSFVKMMDIAGNNHASYVELYKGTIEAAIDPTRYPEGSLRTGAQRMRQALLDNRSKMYPTN